ncbi:DUF1036 domain-containing protein [Sedimentitalea nanhaiensis]|uniref:Uncharacterized protein n=1 Tax=Sedimentitalea nanhaiensis TaxID=999627 RepID=A0A1I6Z102_9RHOB|nr:DUF1036 domain-containing protein [Sedimentitalea nanhaiensis]SFT56405.1 Protein of unknown function [Sedimentitalea nanhaiensis]
MKTTSIALAAILLAAAPTVDASERRSEWNNPKSQAVHFTNNCRRPVKLAMRYKDTQDRWVTGGWWYFAGNERSHLKRSSTGRRVATYNRVVYYYAETTGGKRSRWSGDNQKRLGNTVLNMKRKELRQSRDGTFTLSIKCD